MKNLYQQIYLQVLYQNGIDRHFKINNSDSWIPIWYQVKKNLEAKINSQISWPIISRLYQEKK